MKNLIKVLSVFVFMLFSIALFSSDAKAQCNQSFAVDNQSSVSLTNITTIWSSGINRTITSAPASTYTNLCCMACNDQYASATVDGVYCAFGIPTYVASLNICVVVTARVIVVYDGAC